MKYKMVVSDCDFTLIDSNGYLPRDNITAIQKIMAMGVKFVIATGRNDLLVKDYADEIGGDINIIGCNGATIRNLNKNITYMCEEIPKSSIKTILAYMEEHKLGYKAYTIDECYAMRLDMSQKIKAITGNNYKNKKDFPVKEVSDPGLILNKPVLKILAVEKRDRLKKIQADLKNTPGVNVVFSGAVCLDFISSKATKGNALLKIADTMGILPKEIVGFGDNENDLSFLSETGLSVCMGNGDENVQRLCNAITKTNDEAGVAYKLNELFNLNMY